MLSVEVCRELVVNTQWDVRLERVPLGDGVGRLRRMFVIDDLFHDLSLVVHAGILLWVKGRGGSFLLAHPRSDHPLLATEDVEGRYPTSAPRVDPVSKTSTGREANLARDAVSVTVALIDFIVTCNMHVIS